MSFCKLASLCEVHKSCNMWECQQRGSATHHVYMDNAHVSALLPSDGTD